jgi:hypothetical protein
MVTHIAGPHCTLEGPDLFLQSSALPVTRLYCEILTERFF